MPSLPLETVLQLSLYLAKPEMRLLTGVNRCCRGGRREGKSRQNNQVWGNAVGFHTCKGAMTEAPYHIIYLPF